MLISRPRIQLRTMSGSMALQQAVYELMLMASITTKGNRCIRSGQPQETMVVLESLTAASTILI